MRKDSILIICLTTLFLIVMPFAMANSSTENLEARILESFDPENRTTDWLVVGSKFTTEGFPRKTYTKAWPEALFGANMDGKDLEVLGVNVKWDRRGYNNIEIIPVKTDDSGNVISNPIQIPGKARKLDIWVWCSNFDYSLEVHLKDINGMVHVLNMGNLARTGWNNFYANIPSGIVQSVTHVSHIKSLELVKIIVWTKPTENVSDFFIYFDQIKVLTDTFITRFDGDLLADKRSVEEIWGGGVIDE